METAAKPFSIASCEVHAPDTIVVTFSEAVDTQAKEGNAGDPGSYAVFRMKKTAEPVDVLAVLMKHPNETNAILTVTPVISPGDHIQLEASIKPKIGDIRHVHHFARVQPDGPAISEAKAAVRQLEAEGTTFARRHHHHPEGPLDDIAAFSVLTEEIGYPPSPLAIPAGRGAVTYAGAGGVGQVVTRAISDVLGWQIKPDSKGFLGALNASFTLSETEGRSEAKWTPRTYAVQTDLSGGISGAQASIYSRAKDALDKSLPLLEGLYPLFKEAKDEDVSALRATVRSQFTDLVNEFGVSGGPRVSRVDQLFLLLIGQELPLEDDEPLETEPDNLGGSLGNLGTLFGFRFRDNQVNTVEDEQDATNFRIVCDYVTSLAQSWENNRHFFGLESDSPFFGTQLVLLSRQLSVIAESVNEVRFTLDSVFIGPRERQTLQISFGEFAGASPMFLEDLLNWVEAFASEEGPRLIQEGGKFAVGQSFVPIGTKLQKLITGAESPTNEASLPRGYRTVRVKRSLTELALQLQELVNLAAPLSHAVTPEPEPGLAVLGITPTAALAIEQKNSETQELEVGQAVPITIIGTGFCIRSENSRSENSGTDPALASEVVVNVQGNLVPVPRENIKILSSSHIWVLIPADMLGWLQNSIDIKVENRFKNQQKLRSISKEAITASLSTFLTIFPNPNAQVALTKMQ